MHSAKWTPSRFVWRRVIFPHGECCASQLLLWNDAVSPKSVPTIAKMAQYTHGSVDHPFATSDILLHDDDYGSHAFPDPFVRADLPCFLVLSSEWRYHLVDVSTLPDDDPVVSHPGRPSVCGLGSCSHMRRFDVPPAGALACSTRGFLGLAGVNVPSAEKCWIFLAHLLCILIQSFAGIGTPADAFDASLISRRSPYLWYSNCLSYRSTQVHTHSHSNANVSHVYSFYPGCVLLHATIASVLFALIVWRPANFLGDVWDIPVPVMPVLPVAPVIIPTGGVSRT
jgi:hypothetical protein